MSKHSKWSKIKNQKAVTDVRKGKIFTKMGRLIAVAARQGGGDPATNLQLRLAIDKARAANVPKDTIERAVEKATGNGGETNLVEAVYEGFGPGGVAVIVECLTDNTNRALGEVKKTFTAHGGNLGGPGTVAWMFQRRGVVRTNPLPADAARREAVELALIEVGAEDVGVHDEGLEVFTSIDALQHVKAAAEAHGLTITDTGIEWIAKEAVPVNESKQEGVGAFIDALDELDDIQNVYSNI